MFFAAYTGMHAIQNYVSPDISKCNTPHVRISSIITCIFPRSSIIPRISANMHKKLAREYQAGVPPSTQFFSMVQPSEDQILKLGEVILHPRPGSDKVFKCMVMDVCSSRVRGSYYVVSYTDNADGEVELSNSEMSEILACRTTVP